MREMIDSGVPWIGKIPKEWKLLRNKNGFHCSKEIVGDKSATTQLLSLTTKGVKEKGQDVVGGKVPESYDTYQTVRKGQLVMCLFDLDCSAVFSGLSPYDGMISPAYKVLDCKAEMESSFASYWFRSVFDGRKFMHYSKNLRYTLTYDEFAVLPMAIPPLKEQQRIAGFLDDKCAEIESILEKTRTSIEEYKKLKQSVITEAVTKGIRGERPMKDSGVDWIGDIPQDWVINRLKFLFELHRGYDLANDLFVNGGIPVYGSGGFMGFHNEIKAKGPNIIIGRSGSTGKLHFVDTDFWPHNTGIYVCDFKGNNEKYIYYVLSSLDMDALSTQTAVPTLDRKKIQESTFVFTFDKAEQQEIAAYLDEKCAAIDSLITSKEALITELESYKKSLIYEYVTGKKEVI